MYLSKWNSFEVSEEPGRDTQIEGSKERSHKKGQSGPSGAGWLTDIFYEDSCFSNLNQKVRERKLFTAGESQLRDTLWIGTWQIEMKPEINGSIWNVQNGRNIVLVFTENICIKKSGIHDDRSEMIY